MTSVESGEVILISVDNELYQVGKANRHLYNLTTCNVII